MSVETADTIASWIIIILIPLSIAFLLYLTLTIDSVKGRER